MRRESLEEAIRRTGQGAFTDDEITSLNEVWKSAGAWMDTRPALARLRERFLLATLGNADIGDTARLIKRNRLPFDLILAAELAHTVKPDPAVYQVAAGLFALKPTEILMVACHKIDLCAAASQGFRTAFVARPLEAGPNGHSDTKPEPEFTFNAVGLHDLARQLMG